MSDATKKLCKVMRRGRGHGYESAMDYWEALEAAIAAVDETMVELPRDAGGVPIRAGDVLDGYGKTIEVAEMRHGRSVWVLVSRDGDCYSDTFAFSHHHAPTVEDVLREMLDAWGELPCEVTNEAIIAEYAAKLQLKED